MKIVRSIKMSEDEVKALTKAAMVDAAAKLLGNPGADEEWVVEIRSYTDSTVSIEPKLPEKPEPEAVYAAPDLTDVDKNAA